MWTRRGFGLGVGAFGLARSAGLKAQEAPSLDERLFVEGRYLPLYLDLKAKADRGDEQARGGLSQYAAFVGDEASALGLYERPRPADAVPPDLTEATARDAIEAIVENAARTRVVILNEAHNVSGHRAFLARVVRALKPLGYDWLAAEAFTPPQGEPGPSVSLYRQGMPYFGGLGWYTFDPVFAETVREAASLGYRFAAYEQDWMQRPPSDAPALEQIADREEAQANNLIAALLGPHPEARVLVYVGYNHAMEEPGLGGTWFAARLKAKTGIDPLTIEQSANWPALDPRNDPSHVAAVLRRFQPTTPIAVSNDGSMFSHPTYLGKMNLSVFHPRVAPVEGRPGWLAADEKRRRLAVSVPSFTGTALLQALRIGDGAAGVPADQLLLAPEQRQATLWLHPATYLLRMETEVGIAPAFAKVTVAA